MKREEHKLVFWAMLGILVMLIAMLVSCGSSKHVKSARITNESSTSIEANKSIAEEANKQSVVEANSFNAEEINKRAVTEGTKETDSNENTEIETTSVQEKFDSATGNLTERNTTTTNTKKNKASKGTEATKAATDEHANKQKAQAAKAATDENTNKQTDEASKAATQDKETANLLDEDEKEESTQIKQASGLVWALSILVVVCVVGYFVYKSISSKGWKKS